ncbi:Lrp/AsnC family transcriptional regulator [Octadecabacter sp.]|nr:Lrp/AsnC family transcriptional regulator [Octadecabacter sp.]
MTDYFTTLDQFDRRILRLLTQDGRMSITRLSEEISLSANATSERLRRLQRDGIITGFHARVSPEAMGQKLTCFVEVKLDRVAEDVFDAFAKAAKASNEIEECYLTAGGFDYLLKTRHRDMDDFRRFLTGTLLRLPGVRETHTFTVMEAIKEGAAGGDGTSLF